MAPAGSGGADPTTMGVDPAAGGLMPNRGVLAAGDAEDMPEGAPEDMPEVVRDDRPDDPPPEPESSVELPLDESPANESVHGSMTHR